MCDIVPALALTLALTRVCVCEFVLKPRRGVGTLRSQERDTHTKESAILDSVWFDYAPPATHSDDFDHQSEI